MSLLPPMPLTDIRIKNASPTAKTQRLFDAGGMYLEISPTGGKWWRLKYRYEGKEKRISLGVYPTISLKEARAKRDQAKKLLANGVNPSDERQAAQIAKAGAASFEAVAREWHKKLSPTWVPSHADRIIQRLEADVFPWIGTKSVSDIKAPELLQIARRVEGRKALDTAHRVLQNCGQVFRYAIATGRAERNPVPDLRGALPPTKGKHHASITDPKAVGGLMRAIDSFSGTFVVRCALQLAPLVFVRPGELRKAEWSQFNLEKAEWRIPAGKMKMRVTHIVPLSRQAVEILTELAPLTSGTSIANPQGPRYVFPGVRKRNNPMSENTILAALRTLGYSKEEMTGHGFRSMASTLLHEQGWNHQVIERQLAHAERNAVSAAYNYAEHLPERRTMMQSWADYLDTLRSGQQLA